MDKSITAYMREWTRDTLLAMQFLTIVPVRIKGAVTADDMPGAAAFFPAVGALQGLLAIVVAMASSRFFDAGITACLILISLSAVNGGFHLDGLADTSDALAVKSSSDAVRDREKRLSVMKDSSTGAIGVAALIFDLLLKFTLLQSLLMYSSSFTRCALLFMMPACAKWTMVQALHRSRPARTGGLGSTFISATGKREAIKATVITVLAALAVAEGFQHTRYAAAAAPLLFILFGALYCLQFMLVRFFDARIGGMTGDTFGAVNEASEIIYLVVANAWLRLSIS